MAGNFIYEERKKAYRKVYHEVDSMDDLINPTDLLEDAGSWGDVSDEVLDDELNEAVSVTMNEGQHKHDIDGLAIKEWISDMPRVDLDDMVFESYDEAIRNNYLPFDIGRMAARCRIKDMIDNGDIEIPRTAENRARNLIKEAVAHKLDPRVDQPQR